MWYRKAPHWTGEEGYEVVGVDINPVMIEYSRQKARSEGVEVDVLEADMVDFVLSSRVDAAFCAINTFRHLLIEEAASNHLKCVGRSLKRGRIYIIDFNLVGPASSYPRLDREEWTIEREGVSVTAAHEVIGTPDLQNRRVTERLTLTAKDRGAMKKIEAEEPFITYTREQFETLIQASEAFQIVSWHGPDFDARRSIEPGPETRRVIVVLKRANPPPQKEEE